MLLELAYHVGSRVPPLRRVLARWWYGMLAQRATRRDWTFMNYGFVPASGAGPALAAADETDRLQVQLYHRVVSPVPLAGRQVLEVGAGRGGGASFLARYHGPAQVTAVDFAPKSVELCRQVHEGVPNLEFTVGDAEALTFPDASFDVVVNVESSHCYANIDRFLAESVRVLRPGGHFLFADFRRADDLRALEAALAAREAWQRIDAEDLTAGVVAALEADDARKRRVIASAVRPRVREAVGEFVGLVGGRMYEGFRSREIVYARYAYRRR